MLWLKVNGVMQAEGPDVRQVDKAPPGHPPLLCPDLPAPGTSPIPVTS